MSEKYFAAVAAGCVVFVAALAPGVFLAPVAPFVLVISLVPADLAHAAYHFSGFEGRPPIHVYRAGGARPEGVTPDEIKSAYNLPAQGGEGTIALIEAHDSPTIESDLNVFSKAFGLPECTTKNGCFEKHKMAKSVAAQSGWALEMSLDVEWAHAIAPNAKILLVEAKTPSGPNLLAAVDYAAARDDVVAVSMSWGGAEFEDETLLDSHFAGADSGAGALNGNSGNQKIAFFAASGDNGAGVSWPAASPYVVGVGGTSLDFSASTGELISEKAWPGSGGGVSAYETEPEYQKSYKIPRAAGMRAVPDVAYHADPKHGYSVYKSGGRSGRGKKGSKSGGTAGSAPSAGWYTIGGTSAGAPQWAAIQALGLSVELVKLYEDKATSRASQFFRDITSGSNGDCRYYCSARKRYDYITGLGAPQTVDF